MELRIGDIFNNRVAGNVVNSDILGGMEFGCKLSGAKVVLVMGHTACGAIKGAIDGAELGNLTGLLAKIKPAVAATAYSGERSSKNYAFVDAVARKNVELTIDNIRKDSPVLAAMESAGAVKIAGGCTTCRPASSISSPEPELAVAVTVARGGWGDRAWRSGPACPGAVALAMDCGVSTGLA
jgi:carbonic anhydrase